MSVEMDFIDIEMDAETSKMYEKSNLYYDDQFRLLYAPYVCVQSSLKSIYLVIEAVGDKKMTC